MKQFYTKIIFFFALFLAIINLHAQCNISNFTLTAVNGVCVQDGAVQVSIPGASGCFATATIRQTGSATDLDFITLGSNGAGQFNNLAPGNYEVRIQQGATTAGPKTVTVASSYVPITVNATAQGTSCPVTAPGYTANGSVTVNFSGGIGPFIVTLTGPGGPYTYNMATSGSHTFTNLTAGNYNVSVKDTSAACTSSESRSATVTAATWLPLRHYRGRRMINSSCQMYVQIEVEQGNGPATQNPGNATYTVGGVTHNLIFISGTSSGAGRYIYRTEYGIPANTVISYNITDGCTSLSGNFNTQNINQYFLELQKEIATDSSCNTVFNYIYRPNYFTPSGVSTGQATQNYYWNYSPNSSVSYYRENPADSNIWEFIETKTYPALNSSSVDVTWQTPYFPTRYKLVFNDGNGCNTFEHIVDARTAVNNNNLEKMVLVETSGILEGLSSFSVNNSGWTSGDWPSTDTFSYPLTFSIARTDGQSSMTVNPSQPYNLAGSYTIAFPYVYSYTANSADNFASHKPVFGDLPLGNYVVTITDACGYSVQRTISLTKPAAYSPTVTYELGCATSNVLYNMGQNTNTQPYGRVYLYQNNGGNLGSLVHTYSASQLLNGQFDNVSPGNYFIVFRNINYTNVLTLANANHSTISTRSVARNINGFNQEYRVAITVNPYQQVAFTTSSLFCNSSDPNSGILAITTTGIPVGFIKYDIWASTANPNTDTPLQTYTTTNLTETEHVFTGLSARDYIVRVSNNCGFTQQTITIVQGAVNVPDPIASPDKICTPGEEVNLAIPLPTSLFDIEWFDGSTSLGTGNIITVNPMATTIYTVTYSVKSSFGCTGTTPGTKTVTITLQNCFCYEGPNTTGTPEETKMGITLLQRAGAGNADNWPMVRNSGHIALESNTKGFVITRIAKADLGNITAPQEGMMVYDTTDKCLKIFSDGIWSCFSTPTCP